MDILDPKTDTKHYFLDPETVQNCQFLGKNVWIPETDVMDQFLDPETDINLQFLETETEKLLLGCDSCNMFI